jgi:predicted dehydrogenase
MLLEGRISVAVVGTGEIATKARIPAYLANRHVDLVGLVDVDKKKAEKTARKLNIGNVFESIDELYEKQDVDAVSICTPPHTHADLAIKALSHGSHVLCEKPMANDVEKGIRMVRASKASQRILMVSSYRRFVNAFRRAKDRIQKGALGHVYCIEDVQLTPSPLLEWGKSPWYYSPEGGGVLSDLGTHSFDLMNYLYDGFPRAISSQGLAHLDSPVEESCVSVLEYPGNRIAVGILSWLSSTNIENVAIHGTVGTLYVSPKFLLDINRIDIPEISLWREASLNLLRQKFRRLPMLNPYQIVDPIQLETDRFITRIRQNQAFHQSALNGLNVLVTIVAAKKAMKENRKVRITPITEA